MRKIIWLMMFVLFLLSCACAEEMPCLEAEILEETWFLSLPVEEAESVLPEPLQPGEPVLVTALGSTYCEALVQGQKGYLRFDAMGFAVCGGEAAQLGMIDKIYTRAVQWGRVTLRTEPRRKAEAITKLCKGQFVIKLETEDEFIRVAGPGFEGYVLKKYAVDAEVREYSLARVAHDDEVYLRIDTGYWDQWIIMRLQPGEVVQLISNVRGWAYLEVHGYRGRMHAEYLEAIE